MRIISRSFRSFIFLCTIFLPVLSIASVTVTNNTDLFFTGTVKSSPCSSEIGDSGVLKPHSNVIISRSEINFFCGRRACNGEFYPSKDCSGHSVATVTLQRDSGISNIVNHDPEHFRFSGGGSNVTVDSVNSIWSKILKWFDF